MDPLLSDDGVRLLRLLEGCNDDSLLVSDESLLRLLSGDRELLTPDDRLESLLRLLKLLSGTREELLDWEDREESLLRLLSGVREDSELKLLSGARDELLDGVREDSELAAEESLLRLLSGVREDEEDSSLLRLLSGVREDSDDASLPGLLLLSDEGDRDEDRLLLLDDRLRELDAGIGCGVHVQDPRAWVTPAKRTQNLPLDRHTCPSCGVAFAYSGSCRYGASPTIRRGSPFASMGVSPFRMMECLSLRETSSLRLTITRLLRRLRAVSRVTVTL